MGHVVSTPVGVIWPRGCRGVQVNSHLLRISSASPVMLGLTVREYRTLEAGDVVVMPDLWHRMVEVFGSRRSWS